MRLLKIENNRQQQLLTFIDTLNADSIIQKLRVVVACIKPEDTVIGMYENDRMLGWVIYDNSFKIKHVFSINRKQTTPAVEHIKKKLLAQKQQKLQQYQGQSQEQAKAQHSDQITTTFNKHERIRQNQDQNQNSPTEVFQKKNSFETEITQPLPTIVSPHAQQEQYGFAEFNDDFDNLNANYAPENIREDEIDVYSSNTRQNNLYYPPAGTKKKKKRIRKAPIIVVSILLIALFGTGFYFYEMIKNAPDNDPNNAFSTTKSMIMTLLGKHPEKVHWQIPETGTADITVETGDTIVEVREKLYDAGFASTAEQLYELLQTQGSTDSMQIGQYKLFGSETPQEIVDRLLTGKTAPYAILGIDEGDTISVISAKITPEEYGFTSEEFLSELQDPQKYKDDYEFLEAIPNNLPSLEGFIPAGEYNLREIKTAEGAVRLLLDQQKTHYEHADMEPKAYFDNLIIASMIEKEVMAESEKPTVSSVIHNRLAADWTLGIDATVKYATGKDDPRVLYEDTQIDSPYNTYINKGLPIGPICSAISQTSFSAAANPENTTYMYYVLKDLDGHHAFSETEEQFNIDKQNMLDLFGYSEEY